MAGLNKKFRILIMYCVFVGIAVQKEFYRLRQKFGKERRKVMQTQARSGAGADYVQYKSDWILYDDLIFLVDYIQPRN